MNDKIFIEGTPASYFEPVTIDRGSCEGEVLVTSNYDSININKSGVIVGISYPTSGEVKPIPHTIPAEISNVNVHIAYDGALIYETIKQIPLVFNFRATCTNGGTLNQTLDGVSVTIVDALAKPLSVELYAEHATIIGKNDGTIWSIIKGGSGDFTFKWTGPNNYIKTGKSLNRIENLSPGLYVLTLTDLQSLDIITNEIYIYNPITPTFVVKNVSKQGVADGSINLTVEGGSGFFRYEWLGPEGFYIDEKPSHFETDVPNTNINEYHFDLEVASFQNYIFRDGPEDINNLKIGIYQLTILDVITGVRVYRSINLKESRLQIQTGVKNVTDFGGSDGEIFVDVLEGSGIYQFDWTGPSGYVNGPNFGKTDYIKDLKAGTYCLRVYDSTLNEYAFDKIEVKEPTLTMIKFNLKNPSNVLSLDGQLEAQVLGGYGPFEYSWLNRPETEDTLYNIGIGLYSIQVIDTFTGEKIQSSIEISSLEQCTRINITLTVTDNTCSNTPNPNGSITTVITGGSGNYRYSWSGPGMKKNNVRVQNPTGLKGGKYILNVFDIETGRTAKAFAIIKNIPFEVQLIVSHPSKKNARDGRIDAIPLGCSGSYSYYWFGIEPNCSISTKEQSLINLRAGNYSVKVEDNVTKMTASASVTLIDDPQMITSTYKVKNNAVSGERTGYVDLEVEGGSGLFDYIWTGSNEYASIHEDIYDLGEGSYKVNIIDRLKQITINDTINIINEGESLELGGKLLVDHISKFGLNDGQIITQVFGGSPPYEFIWSRNGKLLPDYDGNGIVNRLMPGLYKVVVSDSCENFIELEATVASPPPNPLNVCLGGRSITVPTANDGIVFSQVSGGYPEYTYYWYKNGKFIEDITDGGISDGLLNNVGPGEYLVEVRDSICQREGALLVIPSPDSDPCFGKRNFEADAVNANVVLSVNDQEQFIDLIVTRNECCKCCDDPVIIKWTWDTTGQFGDIFTGGVYLDDQMLITGELKWAKCGVGDVQVVRLKINYKPNEIGLVPSWPSKQLNFQLLLELSALCDSRGNMPFLYQADPIPIRVTVLNDPNFDSTTTKFKSCANC